MNQYTGLTECYDLLMRAGYYDHDAIASAANSVIGPRTSVLEIGAGTGLFVQSLANVNRDCCITGVDFTPSMLSIAQDRVGDHAELVHADVTSMDLGETFDIAISCGGVWIVMEADGDFLLGTHLLEYDRDVEGLRNVREHLKPDGLLLLSIQEMHRDFELMLSEGVTYSQRVSAPPEPDDYFMIEKEYRFTRGSELLADETLTLGFYRRSLMDEILSVAGFKFDRIDDDRRFFVYSKTQN